MTNRSYTTTLLFENLLYLPQSLGKDPAYQLLQFLLNPRVRLVMEDCQQGVALRENRQFIKANLWESSSPEFARRQYEFRVWGSVDYPQYGTPILYSDISSIDDQMIHVKHPAHCNVPHNDAEKIWGICRQCYYAGLLMTKASIVDSGSSTVIQHYYETPLPFSVLASDLPPVGSTVQVQASYGRMKPFFKPSEVALLNWLANTYSGSLVGLRALDDVPLPVKASLYSRIIPATLLQQAVDQAMLNSKVPSNYKDYLERVEDPLEKALLAVLLYSLYGVPENIELPSVFPPADDLEV